MSFDTQILLDDNKNEKALFDLEIDRKNKTKRISTKMLKMDENNQYGQAMTKASPYGCIKKQEHPPSLLEFNKILDKISHDDKIWHLFIVDIKFYNKNSKTLLFNEIYTPVFEKAKKKMEPFERSTLQLMSILEINEENDKINTFSYSPKTYSTLEEKKFIPLYGGDLHFLIKRAGSLVTYICEHYTFEQSKFKKDFVVMNQKSRQKSTTSVEKDFLSY